MRARDAELPIIVVTAQREIETAVSAMRAGAYDYITKPLDRDRLLLAVHRARERRELVINVRRLESALTERSVLGAIVGKSPPMRELAHQVQRVLESDVGVCLLGESGTGKELVARAIHRGGQRRRGPFVAINCAGIPESLQESELFGHERGAFSGATQMRRGCFEQANGGTLLLDEIGEMSLQTQASLLRTLQEKTIRRVGGLCAKFRSTCAWSAPRIAICAQRWKPGASAKICTSAWSCIRFTCPRCASAWRTSRFWSGTSCAL